MSNWISSPGWGPCTKSGRPNRVETIEERATRENREWHRSQVVLDLPTKTVFAPMEGAIGLETFGNDVSPHLVSPYEPVKERTGNEHLRGREALQDKIDLIGVTKPKKADVAPKKEPRKRGELYVPRIIERMFNFLVFLGLLKV